MGGHSHRAGKLKQTNKKNKRATASKRSKNRLQGGKVNASSGGARKSLKASTTNEGSAKANRLNAAKQKRDASKKTLLQARRGLLASVASSVVVGIISLSEQEGELEECVRQFIVGGADKVIACESDGTTRTVTAAYSAHTKGGQPHLTLLTNSTEEDASVNAALDLCRVCDLVLFLVDSSSVTSSMAINASIGGRGGGSSIGGGMSIAATSIKTSANTAHLDHLISERGDRILTAIKAQGMPTPVTLIVHKEIEGDGSPQTIGGGIIDLNANDAMEDDDEEDEYEEAMSMGVTTHRSSKSIRRTHIRRRAELKKYISRFASTEFGENSKVFEIDIATGTTTGGSGDLMDDIASVSTSATSTATTKTQSETSCAALIRMLCTMSASGTSWVADSPRPFLITDGSDSAPCKDIKAVQYDEMTQELKLTGYIRGNSPWNVNHLAHVPHLGTFAVKHVKLAGSGSGGDQLPPIVAMGRKQRVKKNDGNVTMSSNSSSDGGILLAESNPEERESLEMFASPDSLEGEQNLIGFDDDGFDLEGDGDDLNDASGKKSDVFEPGTSPWLDAIGEDEEDAEDRGELAYALNKKNGDATTVGGGDAFMDDDVDVNAEEKRTLLAQRKQDRESDLQFPDEVDHEEEGAARDRYARYRSIKSFRKSYWDPKENLPDSYGAVYHFSSFKATQKDVMLDMKDMSDIVMKKGCGVGVSSGKDGDAVMDDSEDEEEEALARACVPSGAYVTITLSGVPSQSYARLSPDTILAAVSLLPHENKASVLHMGLSQSLKCENDPEVPIKSKDVLTFRCGWRTWQSRPVFSQNNLNSDKHKFERYMPTGGPSLLAHKRREFLAHGSMLGADADRIVLKRIILTGYPTRVHKRHATVKYMFYNPDDVRWFMPAGLTTKHGLQGNIVQSVGDHGVMKCLFNAPIKQHDTVCLALYKRVYPKLAPTGDEEAQHLVVL
ncbi:40S ribosome biogenesis protein, Bms1/Tsr1 family [Skeletonema marinoi]|uniref:40S ribosome biogenesis protein, Bms1/Tsr1 family n=1 Tax=Skeletonema marinoi TaxID=267567 RepID=A0AAD8YID9_9STRA|nr:40S ribosome biogenesis protein, Bms1/Tsr1 family [Skeletonema marinoi]